MCNSSKWRVEWCILTPNFLISKDECVNSEFFSLTIFSNVSEDCFSYCILHWFSSTLGNNNTWSITDTFFSPNVSITTVYMFLRLIIARMWTIHVFSACLQGRSKREIDGHARWHIFGSQRIEQKWRVHANSTQRRSEQTDKDFLSKWKIRVFRAVQFQFGHRVD